MSEGRKHTRFSKEGRIPRNHGHNFPGFGRDPLYGSIREETTNMSLARSDMSLVEAARNKGHNTEIGKGIWSLHAKVTTKCFNYNQTKTDRQIRRIKYCIWNMQI